MADENDKRVHGGDDQPPQGNRNSGDDLSPSLIFVEMMRQAAARRASQVQDEAEPDEPARNPFDLNADDFDFLKPLPESRPAPAAEAPAVLIPPAPPEMPTAAPPPEPAVGAEQTRYEEAMKIQRVRREERRQQRRRQRSVGIVGGFMRTALIVLLASGLASTIFLYFTDPAFLGRDIVSGLQVAEATSPATEQPTAMPTPNWLRRIGIVAGHRGPENDPGAVCPDGLTETEINFNVAQIVVRNLRAQGFSVDLLDEFDPRLDNYQAAALVSIHSNSCEDYGEFVSGYLVAKAASRPDDGPDVALAECLAENYEQATSLERRFTLTVDMTDYHSFREIHPLTPAAIIELGFMLADRALLTNEPDRIASGITSGVLCFMNPPQPGDSSTPTATPTVLAGPAVIATTEGLPQQ